MAESNALFMDRDLWLELGGYDERFTTPGGGLANLDAVCQKLANLTGLVIHRPVQVEATA